MRSRSWPERATLALGAATDGLWCGALAAALTGAPWAALVAFAGATIGAGALVAGRLDRGAGSGGGDGAGRERAARLLALALILFATGVLLAAGRAWAHPSLFWQTARDLVYACGLVLVGIYLGRAGAEPDVAVRRAVRAFALLCVVLAAAAWAGSAPAWAPWAVVAALVVGGLLVAVARYQALTDLVGPAERMPAWPWLLAVAGAVLVVVAVGALLSQVLRVDAVLWALHLLGGALRFALEGVAYVLGYAGAALLRGIAWVLGAFHLHAPRASDVPGLAAKPPTIPPHYTPAVKFPSVVRLVGTIVGIVLAIGALLALVMVALRRMRRQPREAAMVVEEREELASLRSVVGTLAGRLGRRLRSRLQGLRRQGPLTPAELVRRRYAELERRLSKAGRPRPPGVTVREYLAAVAAAAAAGTPDAPADARDATPAPPPASSLQPAADLAGIYEFARYSAHTVDVLQLRRFDLLASGFEA